jgi:guanylate kinase
VDYHFVSVAQFHAKAQTGDFLEWKEVHGNFYATPLKDMERLLAEGQVAVLKIDVQGALTVMALRPDAITIFLLPPSVEELEARIRRRRTDEEEVILRRLKNAHDEMAQAGRYQHQLVNDDLSDVVRRLLEVVG